MSTWACKTQTVLVIYDRKKFKRERKFSFIEDLLENKELSGLSCSISTDLKNDSKENILSKEKRVEQKTTEKEIFNRSSVSSSRSSVLHNDPKINSSSRETSVEQLSTQDDIFSNKESSKTICEKLKKNVGIVLDRPRFFNYATLDLRIHSFKNWPNNTIVDIECLAICGFYYTGTSDFTRCFHCGVEVSKWSKSMDPWETHALRFPYCAHVRNCKGDTFILRILGDEVDDQRPTDIVELTMFRNSDAIEAVRSVFGYDEIIIEQAVSSLINRKINIFNGEKLVEIIEEIDNLPLDSNHQMTDKHDNEPGNLDMLKEENENLNTSLLCKICFIDRARIIILPCGHMCSCPQCVPALAKCPVCRITVQGTVRALFCTE